MDFQKLMIWIIPVVFGSSLLTVICSSIFDYNKTKKNHKLNMITKERKEWRKDIRQIVDELGYIHIDTAKSEEAIAKELQLLLNKIKVRINPIGNKSLEVDDFSERELIEYDSEVWKHIRKLEQRLADSDKLDNEFLSVEVNGLVESLGVTLKFDWENSKYEVIGKEFGFFSVGNFFTFLAMLMLFFSQVEYISKITNSIFHLNFQFLNGTFLFYLFMWASPIILREGCLRMARPLRKNGKTRDFFSFIIAIICVIPLIMSIFLNISFSVSQQGTYIIVCCVIFISSIIERGARKKDVLMDAILAKNKKS